MKKIDDFFGAGVIIGSIGNIWTNIFPLLQLWLGFNTRTPWGDLAALFFQPPQVSSTSAQVFGFLATFGVAISNGIILGGLLKFTGRDFAYIKSIVVCSSSVMFAFMILYPALGHTANQHSIVTTYSALINNQPFAIIMAFLFLRFTTIGQKELESETKKILHKSQKFVPVPALKKLKKEKNVHFIKPKKL